MMPAMDSCRPARSWVAGGRVLRTVVSVKTTRVVEAADEVLAGAEVDAGFAADRRVDLGREGGRDLDIGDSAHVDGGEEAGNIADNSATEGDEECVAVSAGVGELLEEGFDGAKALVGFAGMEEEDGRGVGTLFWK